MLGRKHSGHREDFMDRAEFGHQEDFMDRAEFELDFEGHLHRGVMEAMNMLGTEQSMSNTL